MSDKAAAFALEKRFGRIKLPRLSLMEVGRRSRISFEKADSLADGLLDVVTSGLGSAKPESIEYSSSMPCCAVAVSGSRDSSYLKSFFKDLSFATTGSSGLPLARDFFKRDRFSAIDASRSCKARR